jgi:hypothetical protein
MRRHWRALAAIVALAAACGGKAVIDPDTTGGGHPGSGGQPGAGGMPGTGGTPGIGGAGLSAVGGSTPTCGTPPPVGNLEGCSGAVTTGTGMFECASFACDDGGNTWTTSCNDTGCTCAYNDAVVCNCGGGSSSCATSCCPFPFP